MMRNVPIQLDGTGQKTQKKKPKRKEVSAKKKRIHGIYNVSTANQRFVDDHRTNYYLIIYKPINIIVTHKPIKTVLYFK